MRWISGCFLLFFQAMAFSSIYSAQEQAQLELFWTKNMFDSGAIIASPSRQAPDYYYDWVRDSAIAMGLISQRFQASRGDEDKQRLTRYVDWVERTQNAMAPHGVDILGEPKFHLSGAVYSGAWGRPQNDGPALRAMALIRFAKTLLDDGDNHYVATHLYQANLDPSSMGAIKKDLEYTAHHWQEENFDLWEEVYGHHFFTALLQRRALIDGAALAERLSDGTAAAFYRKQAQVIELRLRQHFNPDNGLIEASLSPHPGPQKWKELDTAVVLAVLLDKGEDRFIALDNPYLKNTVDALKTNFATEYPINYSKKGAVLFGRYPGDTYDGYHTDGQGNPWFILTATIAEYYYRLATQTFSKKGETPLFLDMVQKGDAYLQLVKEHSPELQMKEQINWKTGIQQGAESLTWSYTAVLSAIEAKQSLEMLRAVA